MIREVGDILAKIEDMSADYFKVPGSKNIIDQLSGNKLRVKSNKCKIRSFNLCSGPYSCIRKNYFVLRISKYPVSPVLISNIQITGEDYR